MAPCSLTEGLQPWQGEGVFLKVLISPAFSESVKPGVQWFTLQNKISLEYFYYCSAEAIKFPSSSSPISACWLLVCPAGRCPCCGKTAFPVPKRDLQWLQKSMYQNNALPYVLSPTSGPPGSQLTTARNVYAWSLPFCLVIAVRLCLLLKTPLVLGLTHGELPQVSVVEKVTQLFPSTENIMIVSFPLMFYKKQPAVKSTKLRRSPDHAHDSWRASNVLCHLRQMDRSVTYTYDPLQQSR